MATFSVNDNVRRTIATGNGSTSSYAFSFQVDNTSDVKVYVDGTLKTEGAGSSNYVIQDGSGGAGLNDSGAGTVIFGTAPANNTTITILSDIPLARTSVYTSGGNITASALESDFDTITMALGDREERDNRSIMAPVNDPTSINMTLPSKDNRKGKYLQFNSTTGNPEAGAGGDDITTLSAISTDIQTLAHLQDGTTTSNGLSTLAGIASNITTVAGIGSSNITTVAGISSAISTNASNISAIQSASANATKAENYATKVDGAVESSNYSAKAWAIGGTGVTDTSGSGSAKSWAVEADQVDGTEHSAKTYAVSGSTLNAGSAKNWAIGGGDSFATSTAIGNTGLYSAKYYAEQAAASKTEFSNVYHGAASSDPTQDPDGSALEAGDLYFNSSSNVLKYYNGSAWANIEAVDTSSFATAGQALAFAIAL